VLDRSRKRYDLAYFVELALEIEAAGAHVLAIKDMTGLLEPEAARLLVGAARTRSRACASSKGAASGAALGGANGTILIETHRGTGSPRGNR
jgi:hypothetical protein